MGRVTGAVIRIDDYDKCVKTIQARALNSAGCVLWHDEKYQEAAQKHKAAYDLCPETEGFNCNVYRTNEAKCYHCLGQYTMAIDLYDEVLAKDAGYLKAKIYKAEVLNDQGCALWHDKKYQEAAEKHKAAYDLCPATEIDDLNLYSTNEANCYHKLKRHKKAIKLYDEVLAKDDGHLMAKIGKAESLNRQGIKLFSDKKYKGALAKFKAAMMFVQRLKALIETYIV